jgi:hypothetical protein
MTLLISTTVAIAVTGCVILSTVIIIICLKWLREMKKFRDK